MFRPDLDTTKFRKLDPDPTSCWKPDPTLHCKPDPVPTITTGSGSDPNNWIQPDPDPHLYFKLERLKFLIRNNYPPPCNKCEVKLNILTIFQHSQHTFIKQKRCVQMISSFFKFLTLALMGGGGMLKSTQVFLFVFLH